MLRTGLSERQIVEDCSPEVQGAMIDLLNEDDRPGGTLQDRLAAKLRKKR